MALEPVAGKTRHAKPQWRLMPRLIGMLVPLLLLAACGGSTPAQTSHPVSLPPLPSLSGLPAAALQGQLTGLLSPDTTLPLTIGLQVNRQGLAQMAQDIYNPSSPRYQKYLSVQQIADQYGASAQTIQQVSSWFAGQGFQVLDTSPLHTSLTVQANVLQIAKAFQVTLQNRMLDGRSFFGPSQAPVLPQAIAPLITSITGLDNFGQLLHAPHPMQPQKAQQPNAGDCTLYSAFGVTRNQLAKDYGIDQLFKLGYKGDGMTIGVVELGEPYSRNDVANYAACNGVQLHARNITIDGDLPGGPGEGEAALDMEMIAGLAPNAQILDYQAGTADEKGFLDDINQIAADDQVQVVSISYGEGEDQTTPSYMAQFDQTLEILAVEGISVFISSGDCAAYVDGVFGQLQVSFPASAPWATAVGGTKLSGSNEVAWSDSSPNKSQCQNTWGTGGGVSQNKGFPRPSWQTGAGVQNSDSNGNRQVPDVAALADNIAIYYRGFWSPVGGTSAAAPIWAAGTLLVDQALKKQGKPPVAGVPTLYQVVNNPGKNHPFRDITQGDNIFYKAGKGWDYPTGWGIPNFPDIGRVLGAKL